MRKKNNSATWIAAPTIIWTICSHATWGKGRVLYKPSSRRPSEAWSSASARRLPSSCPRFLSLGVMPPCLLKTLLLLICSSASGGIVMLDLEGRGSEAVSSFLFLFFFYLLWQKGNINLDINEMGNWDSPHGFWCFLGLIEQEQRRKVLSDGTV